MATLRDKLSVQVEERSQMESTIAQLKDKLHQTEVSHSATKGEVCSFLFSRVQSVIHINTAIYQYILYMYRDTIL